MVPTYLRYPLLVVILVSIALYALTYPLDKSTVYLGSVGLAYAISWIIFIILSFLLVHWNKKV